MRDAPRPTARAEPSLRPPAGAAAPGLLGFPYGLEANGGPVSMSSLSPPAACWLCGAADSIAFPARPLDGPGEYRYLRCGRCGLARLHEQPAERALDEFYAEEYQPVCGEFAGGRQTLLGRLLGANFRRVAARIEALAPPGRLLDVGCGAGVFLSLMQRRGWRVAGVEPNLALARELRVRRGLDVHAGGLDEIPDGWGPFDVVTLFHVVEHLADPAAGLERVRSLVRKDGVVVVVTPNVEALEHRLFGRHWYALQPPDHLWLFSRRALRILLELSRLADPEFVASPVGYPWLSLRRRLGLAALPEPAETLAKAALALPFGLGGRAARAPAELEVYAQRSA